MIEPIESNNLMRTAGMADAAWRILSKDRLTMRAYEGSNSIRRTLPERVPVDALVKHAPEISLNPAASQSMHVRAVKVSLTAADKARMPISTIWSMAKTGSCTSVRCGPVTWAFERARDTSFAALGGYTLARARP